MTLNHIQPLVIYRGRKDAAFRGHVSPAIRTLSKAVFLASNSEFLSFQEGLPKQWEGYKDEIYKEGRKRLDWQSWTPKDVQSGIPIVE